MNDQQRLVVRHPWILVFYLLAVTFAAFLLPDSIKATGVAVLFAMQLVVLAAFRSLHLGDLARIFDRLRILFFFLIAVNAFLPGPATGRYWPLAWGILVNLEGLFSGAVMCAQIALVVLTTHVVRTIGDERSFIDGLRSLRIAPLLAYSLDTTFALVGGSLNRGAGGGQHRKKRWWNWIIGGGRHSVGGGGGGGGGGGDQAAAGEETSGGVLALFRALRNRDISPFVDKINNGLADATRHAARLGLSRERAHDVGVIGGIAAVMMAFKLVKVLPGLPVMQGAKMIFFIPLYILAADRTHTRWGGTIAGGIMGFLAFLNGDSRYGLFEILKHLVPGLTTDIIWPVVRRLPLRIWILVLVGWIAAAARTSTQFGMIFAPSSDNATLLVFPALKLIPNAIAGTLSAFVTYPVLKHLGSRAMANKDRDESLKDAPEAELALRGVPRH